VIVTKQTGKPVYLLGEVKKPGYLRLKLQASLLEAISQAEGLTETADLQGSLLIRDGQVLPVNFEKLLRRVDFTQNINLQPQDTIFIPNISYRKVLILGEVKNPQVFALKPGVTLIELIAQAGGFTKDAVPKHTLVLRGGLGDPQVMKVNADEITKRGSVPQNILLQPNDIVYVPKTILVDVERYVALVAQIAQTFFFAEFGISVYPSVKAAITGESVSQTTTVVPVTR
jgi:protein involved in polysaccharide export with SLBB domain